MDLGQSVKLLAKVCRTWDGSLVEARIAIYATIPETDWTFYPTDNSGSASRMWTRQNTSAKVNYKQSFTSTHLLHFCGVVIRNMNQLNVLYTDWHQHRLVIRNLEHWSTKQMNPAAQS